MSCEWAGNTSLMTMANGEVMPWWQMCPATDTNISPTPTASTSYVEPAVVVSTPAAAVISHSMAAMPGMESSSVNNAESSPMATASSVFSPSVDLAHTSINHQTSTVSTHLAKAATSSGFTGISNASSLVSSSVAQAASSAPLVSNAAIRTSIELGAITIVVISLL